MYSALSNTKQKKQVNQFINPQKQIAYREIITPNKRIKHNE
jgi:hypothetical protein